MEELAAAAALLGFDGEMSTQQAFDVITFATGAHSWSQEFERRNKMLEDGRIMLAGRQVCHMHSHSFHLMPGILRILHDGALRHRNWRHSTNPTQ